MFFQLNSIVVDADPGTRQEMATFLSDNGVNVIAAVSTIDQLKNLLDRSHSPQLVVVNLDPAPHDALQKLSQIVRDNVMISFFALSQMLDASLLMEAMHLGVKEFIPLPVNPEKFLAGIERVSSLHGIGKRATTIHVIPAAGGCGSTTVACNVAASLAEKAKTVLVDLDLLRGGVAGSFDIRPRFTISDLMSSSDKIDKQLLENALAVHKGSNLSILARPELPEDSQRVTPAGVGRLLSVLGQLYDYVVVDSLMSLDPIYTTAINAADVNLLVTQLNVPCTRNAERFIGAMRRLGVESVKIRVVANRFVRKGTDLDPADVEKALGAKIDWMLPNDFKNAIAAVNFGQPVVLRAPRAELSTSLKGLSGTLNGKSSTK